MIYHVSPLRPDGKPANFNVLIKATPETLEREVRLHLGWTRFHAVSR
jgi:hypothetical protein